MVPVSNKEGSGLLRPDPSSYPYSPNLVVGVFSEVGGTKVLQRALFYVG